MIGLVVIWENNLQNVSQGKISQRNVSPLVVFPHKVSWQETFPATKCFPTKCVLTENVSCHKMFPTSRFPTKCVLTENISCHKMFPHKTFPHTMCLDRKRFLPQNVSPQNLPILPSPVSSPYIPSPFHPSLSSFFLSALPPPLPPFSTYWFAVLVNEERIRF